MAHTLDEMICCLWALSIDCSFFFNYLEAGGYFSLDNFNILCLWPKRCYANNWRFFHSLQRQMLALGKSFPTASSAAFIHMRRHSQHKMKVHRRGFKSSVFKKSQLLIRFVKRKNMYHITCNNTSQLFYDKNTPVPFIIIIIIVWNHILNSHQDKSADRMIRIMLLYFVIRTKMDVHWEKEDIYVWAAVLWLDKSVTLHCLYLVKKPASALE